MPEALIIEAARTPIAKRSGALRNVRADDLAALVLRAVVARAVVDPGQVEDVILGCNTQIKEQGLNVARLAALIAGFPETVAGTSVNRLCGSGQQAVDFAAQAIMSGNGDLMIGGGVESMTRVPLLSDMDAFNPRYLARFQLVPQGISADLVADKYGITRQQMDEYSLESHRRAIAAIDHGLFRKEIVAVPAVDDTGKELRFDNDEHPRRDTTIERMAALKPAFKPDGRITAGNSSGIGDGAAALLLASREKADELGLKPRARFVSMAVVGVNPVVMLDGTIPAIGKALERAGLAMDDIDLWEINEAFASVPLATAKTLGIDHSKMNVNGGAIALGHPLGCSGARLMTTLLHEMQRRGSKYGLSSLCIGLGQGIATIIECEG
jgi:acetyl-CoA acyltransferase